MDHKLIEKFFESILTIEEEAENAIIKSKEATEEKERHLRKQFRDLELDIMKEVHQNSKLHYQKRMNEAKKEEARIFKEENERSSRLKEIAENKKQVIAQQIFYKIFVEKGKSHG
jgi:hypothetical protein